jgi:Mrp family chromosome partitioning ATPase
MVAVNLAAGLKATGRRVGLLDVDIHGPSVPTMLGVARDALVAAESELIPVDVLGMKVLSIGFLLRDPDDAVIWRGPLKMGVIRQFLTDAAWGDLDYLVVDSPPGTGDEPLSIVQLVGTWDGAVIVTTPQKVATVDVRRSITFCRRLDVPVLGIVENMSEFACPACGTVTPIFRTEGGRAIARDMGIPFLGSVPLDPRIVDACDLGRAFIFEHPESPAAAVLRGIVQTIAAADHAIPVPPDSEGRVQ